MPVVYISILSLFIVYLIFLFFEYLNLNKSLKKIPIRILVNGTRGKSTTVKILYRILRNEKYTVCARTTGDLPIEYYSNGDTKILKRIAPASILEIVRMLRKWTKYNPDAIVVECMALHPENQRTLAEKMIKPTHIIVTNVLNDHFEVMGDSLKSVYQSIQESFVKDAIKIVPPDFSEFTTTDNMTEHFEEDVFPTKYLNIPPKIINQNWSLITTVCKHFKINSENIKSHFHNTWLETDLKTKMINNRLNYEFWNLFSVNDVDSTQLFIEHILTNNNVNTNYLIIFNARSDRPLRTKSFISLLNKYFNNADILLVGNGKYLVKNLLRKTSSQRFRICNTSYVKKLLETGFEKNTVIIGLGNHKGIEHILNGDRA